MDLFLILKDILKDKRGDLDQDPAFKTAFSGYMILRYLSMSENPEIQKIAINASKINMMNIGDSELYQYLVMTVPRTNNTFIKYIRKPSTTEKKKKALPVLD